MEVIVFLHWEVICPRSDLDLLRAGMAVATCLCYSTSILAYSSLKSPNNWYSCISNPKFV